MTLKERVRSLLRFLSSLSLLQRVYAAVFLTLAILLTFVLAEYHQQLLAWVEPLKHELRKSSWKWIYIASAIAVVSVPPFVGFATSVTLAGFFFGVGFGFLVAVVGSTIGACAAFVLYRWFLSSYAIKLTSDNPHFRALTEALAGSPGRKLLIMIRFCPLPFSLSNAALSTIPSVSLPSFVFATLSASPRLLLHVFIGSRLASMTEDQGNDPRAFWLNAGSALAGVVLGVVTGFLIYKRTMKIAARFELASRDIENDSYHDRVDERIETESLR
ncbi:Tlg2-vesicle protein [Savitreella phatthalungensis]